MKHLQSILRVSTSPTAIGIFLTLFVTWTAFQFYTTTHSTQENESALQKLVRIAHQKSIDLRLQARGPRFGSPQVALLAVDERSVESVGRWPWPRETTAEALKKAVDLGAKVIAFDVVFSEESDRSAQRLFDDLKADKALLPQSVSRWSQMLVERDSDRALASVITSKSENIVLGSFFEYIPDPLITASYQNLCHDLVFEQSKAFGIWDQESVILSVRDPFEVILPDIIRDTVKQHLAAIEEEIRSNTKNVNSRLAQVELKNKVQSAKLNYCLTWLDPAKDELYEPLSQNWAAIKEQAEDLTAASFEEWAEDIKSRSLRNAVLPVDGWTMNTAQISAGGKHTGFFNAQLDKDGTIRRSRLIARTGTHYMPSISLKAYLIANNYNAEVVLKRGSKDDGMRVVDHLRITNNETGDEATRIPTDEEGNLAINYAGDRNMFAYASFGDLLSSDPEIQVEQQEFDPQTKTFRHKVWKEPKAAFFKDKIFILGATAIGIFDLRVTPFDENFPGAETHVNVIDNLVRGDFLRTNPEEEPKMLLFLMALGIALSFSLARFGAIPGMIITIGLLIGLVFFDRHFLFASGMVVAVIFPLMLVLSLYVGLTFFKYFTEERKKRELRSTFSKYVSPAIVDEILKDPSNLELGGRKERITVFFSDVRGFTTISEKLDPKALSDLLNSYLTPMTDLVFQNRGTLDKYMGDAIMGFFGAPISYKDHAAHACRCALAHIKKLEDLQEIYRKNGLPALDIGIGLNTGECSVGNMGSQTVRNYTVMGDAVNLASRLEGITKTYGTRIIISEFTYQDVQRDFICREVDWVKVKGKAQPVKIYELIAEGKIGGPTAEMLKHFEEGYHLYHARQFERGSEAFSRALNVLPTDNPSQLYFERCQAFSKTPPPEDWDGAYVMTTK